MSEMNPQFEPISTGKLINPEPVKPSTPEATYEPKSFETLWLWFVWLIGAGYPLCIIMVVILVGSGIEMGIIMVCMIIGIIPVIAGFVIGLVLLYRFWHVIQDGETRTSPGKAVGFCFIPFYNIYWIFVAIPGLAEDMNTYCDERNIAVRRISKNLALAYCILSLIGIIPYLKIPILISKIVIQIILCKQFADAAACIMEIKMSQAKPV